MASLAEQRLGLAPGSFPFASDVRAVGRARLHVVDEGQGPALLMLHGNPTWSFLFRDLIAQLRDRYRCLAVDLPGFGLSEPPPGFGWRPQEHADLVAALLEQLDLRGATLVAHDWGGPIGLAAAFAHPGRLTRFVLGNTWAWPLNGIGHFEWFARLAGGPLGRVGARRWNLFVNGLMPLAMRSRSLSPAQMAAYRAPFADPTRRIGTHVFPAELLRSRTFLSRIERGLPSIDASRLLLLWPGADFAFRPQELARWRTLFPGVRVVDLPGCGHFVFEEAGPSCARHIVDWLGTQSSCRWTGCEGC